MTRLPLVACFHGGGSNASVMGSQCSRLQSLLSSTFEFVYFDAPFPRSAGPGVLPGFKDYGPFKTWFKIGEDGNTTNDGSGYDYVKGDGIERVLKMMLAKGAAHEWVGALGFSQGTRVVSGLLLDQQMKAEKGEEMDVELKFGVICMGSSGPMVSRSFGSELDGSRFKSECNVDSVIATENERSAVISALEIGYGVDLITTPTLHLHGLRDTNLNNGRKQLATFFEPESTRLLEIDYHHAMPWEKSDSLQFAEMVTELYNDTKC